MPPNIIPATPGPRWTPEQYLLRNTRPRLGSLPDETILQIVGQVDTKTLARLCLTNRRFYDLLVDLLYKRDVDAHNADQARNAADMNVSRMRLGWVPINGGKAIRHGCYHGYPGTIALAAQHGANIHQYQSVCEHHATPMTVAVNGAAPWNAVPKLLSLGVDPNADVISHRHTDLRTYGNYATLARTIPLIVLIESLRESNTTRHRNPLIMRAIRALLDHGAEPNRVAAATHEKYNVQMYKHEPQIHVPLVLGSSNPKPPDITDIEPWSMGTYTALAAATRIADWDTELCAELMELLLSHGASPDGSDVPVAPKGALDDIVEADRAIIRGRGTVQITPLQASFFSDQHELLLQLLLSVGADPKHRRAFLAWAKSKPVVNLLSSAAGVPLLGTDLSIVHPSVDMTPLEALLRWMRKCNAPWCASLRENGHAIAERLLVAGADPNGTTDALYGQYWDSPLLSVQDSHIAMHSIRRLIVPYIAEIMYTWPGSNLCEPYLVRMVQIMLKHGADVKQRFTVPGPTDPKLFTPLEVFLRGNKMEAEMEKEVLYEILNGAKNESTISRGQLLQRAIDHRKPHLIETILKCKGNPNVTAEGNRMTILHYAVQKLHLEAVRILLEWSAYPSIKDRWGREPADCCIDIFERIVRLETAKPIPIIGQRQWVEWRESQLLVTMIRLAQMLYRAGAQLKMKYHLLDMLPKGICRCCLGDVYAGTFKDDISDDSHNSNEGMEDDAEDGNEEGENEQNNDDEGDEDDDDDSHNHAASAMPPPCVCIVHIGNKHNVNVVLKPDDNDTENRVVEMAFVRNQAYWRGQYFTAIEDRGSSWWRNWRWDRPGDGGSNRRDMRVSRAMLDLLADSKDDRSLLSAD